MRFMLAGCVSAIALSLTATAAIAAGESTAPTPIILSAGGYTQDFNTLANSGAGPFTTLPAGWRLFEGTNNTAADGAYIVGTGSANGGNAYSFGATESTDRALGSLASGNDTPIIYGAYFTNSTGAAITSLSVAYFGEQWRRGTSTDDQLSFSYFIGTPASLNTGTWTTVSALDFVSSQTGTTNGATDGNTVRTSISSIISGLSIASGSTFAIRWVDVDSTGADDGLAIDDFSIRAVTASVPEPASWAMMVGGFGMLGAALRRRRTPAFA